MPLGLISVICVALQSTSKFAKTSVLIGAVVLVPTVEGRDEDGQFIGAAHAPSHIPIHWRPSNQGTGPVQRLRQFPA